MIEGPDAHINFLSKWFTENNPKWTNKYIIANEYTNEDRKIYKWITSEHELTLPVGKVEVKLNQVH